MFIEQQRKQREAIHCCMTEDILVMPPHMVYLAWKAVTMLLEPAFGRRVLWSH
jgi:hypothetical protein